MPIVSAWANINEDARLIGIAATLRAFKDDGNFNNDVIRKHVGNLAQGEMELIGPAMHIAQWISGKAILPA